MYRGRYGQKKVGLCSTPSSTNNYIRLPSTDYIFIHRVKANLYTFNFLCVCVCCSHHITKY